MAACHLVYGSRHLQADCQEPGSALEPYARQSSMGYLFTIDQFAILAWYPEATSLLFPSE